MTRSYTFLRFLSISLLSFLFHNSLLAQPPAISYAVEFGGLSGPVDIANAGDGSNRLFIVQQAGTIVVRNGATVTQFADFGTTGANIITSGGEQGLLSMAFHPAYDGITNRFFFIYYNDLSGDIAVSRCQTTAGNINTADISTLTPIITISHPTQSNHNGGKLNFGADGYLYFATGDGGGGNDGPNNAQTGTVLLGKMLRIDIDQTSVTYGNYAVPPDNPYVGNPSIDERIWAIGLRNPFRWSFDTATGDMWIGDVGQGSQEEINFRPAGSTGNVNYGWRCFEGYPSTPAVPDCTPANYVPPVYDYPNPGAGPSSVVGGFVYRGSEYPTLPGYYIAADVYSGDIFILWPNGTGGFDSAVQSSAISFIVGFGEGEDGTLYAVSQGTNTLYKVVGTGGTVLPVRLSTFSGMRNSGYNQLKWKTSSEINTIRFNIEYSLNASSYSSAGSVAASGFSNGGNYSFRHMVDNQQDIFYRLAIEDNNGSIKYSNIIRIAGSRQRKVIVYPTVLNSPVLNLDLNGLAIKNIQVVNSSGIQVFKKDISTASGKVIMTLPQLATGIYLVKLRGEALEQIEKIIIQ